MEVSGKGEGGATVATATVSQEGGAAAATIAIERRGEANGRSDVRNRAGVG